MPKDKLIAVYACSEGFEQWQQYFQACTEVEVTLVPMDDPLARQARVAVAWLPPPGYLASLPDLELICSMGMGVNGLVDDPSIPESVPIVRLVDLSIATQMTEYVVGVIAWDRRRFDDYRESQCQQQWQRHRVAYAQDVIVTVLGLGVIGATIAQALVKLGYQVRGWRNRHQPVEGVEVYTGEDGWQAAVAGAHYIVNVLPLTPHTTGILNQGSLSGVADGAHLINIARGDHLVEADLIPMLDAGQLGKATLDVTTTEPLPGNHPFWQHPNIFITPHISGVTYPRSAARQILQTIQDFSVGNPLDHVVNRSVGY